MNKHKNKKNKYQQIQFLYTLPSLIVIAIIPLIVRLKILTLPKEDLVWKTESLNSVADFFTYYKGYVLIIIASLSLLILIYQYINKNWALHKNKTFILLFVYILVVILSALFSNYKHVSLIGYNERFEGLYILISYIIVFMYTATQITSEAQIKLIIKAWCITSFILFIVGLSQVFGFDLIRSTLGTYLTVPLEYRALNVNTDTDTARNVYQTLYHYNYVSFYAALGFPFFLTLGITEKKLSIKFLYLLIATTFFISQVLSLSRNGYIGFLVGLILILIFLRKKVFIYWKVIIPSFLIIGIITTVFISTSDSLSAIRIRQVFDSIQTQNNYMLNSVEATQNTLAIDHDDIQLKIEAASNNGQIDYILKDFDNTPYLSTYDEEKNLYSIDSINPNLFTYSLGNFEGDHTIKFNIKSVSWYLIYKDDTFYLINPDLTFNEIEGPPTFGFKGYETFGSSRGYIWSRALPMVLSNGLLGSGPDTFALAFPQSDLIGKYNAYNTPYMVVDKAHNIYLDYATNTGLLSLLLMLSFWGIYVYKSISLYIKADLNSFYTQVGMACFISVMSYFASGIFNDSSLNVTPSFWILLGLGYSVNQLVKAKASH